VAKVKRSKDVYEVRWCLPSGGVYLMTGDGVCKDDAWRQVSACEYKQLREGGYRVRKNGKKTTRR